MYFFLLSLRMPQLVSSLRLSSDQTPSLPRGKEKKGKKRKRGERERKKDSLSKKD